MSGFDPRPDEGTGAYVERLIAERDEARAAAGGLLFRFGVGLEGDP